MRRLLAAAVLLPLLPLAATAQPIEGLYVAAGAGVNLHDNATYRGITAGGSSSPGGLFRNGSTFVPGYAAVGSVGWAFGNGFRVEVEGDLRNNRVDPQNYQALANSFLASPGSRSFKQSGHETKTGAMINALFDMDIGSPYIFPYIGGGAGYQNVAFAQTLSFNATGSSAVLHTQGNQNSFAYQGILGAAFPIPGVVGLSATAEYRYLGVNGVRRYNISQVSTSSPTVSGFEKITGNDNHAVMLGLRYAFNVTPPPMAAAPAPVAAPVVAPAPAPSRSYLVFFDWDKADLTARAQQIIAEAAKNASRVQTTKIAVAGHADKSGTAAYNQSLSLARANNVAAELVRLGVAKSAISISAFGDTKPLVPTAAGVREPQNRRVEIVLQ